MPTEAQLASLYRVGYQLTFAMVQPIHLIGVQAYLGRLNQRSPRIIARPNDADFDQKVQAAIQQRLDSAGSYDSQQANH